MKISKELSLTMKGIAIMFIALHNFLHLERFGLVQENEMQFDFNRTTQFFDHLQAFSWTIIYDIFSFIGWCGVPVFVFLSGYGLSMKYEHPKTSIDAKSYIRHSYLKLLVLILPATLFFLIYQLSNEQYLRALFSCFSSFTFLNTLVSYGISIPSAAAPYWYFALTLQLYVLYLILYKFSNSSLVYVALIFILIQFAINPDCFATTDLLHYVKKNFYGWLPFFILGLFCARKGGLLLSNRLLVSLISLLSFVLIFLMNINYYLWIMMPFASIVFFLSISILLNNITMLKKVGVWLGKNSPYIFVTHQISIILVLALIDKIPYDGMWVWVILYIGFTLCLSLLYGCLHNYLSNLLLNRNLL